MRFDPVSERVLLNLSLKAEETPLKDLAKYQLYGKLIVKKTLHQQYFMHT